MKIIGTGLSGLVGSRVIELLGKKHSFINLSLETGVDITNPQTVSRIIGESDAEWVFHFAAMTDVDGAEKERSLGNASKYWTVNVTATQYVADTAKKNGKKLLYISTDYVFDGTRPEYREEDTPNPQGWYAQTKYEGEKIVQDVPDSLIVRIANPYCITVGVRPDFVHKIIDRLAAGQSLTAPTDQLFIPTLVDDIAIAIEVLIGKQAHGVYHVVGASCLSPFAAAQKIAAAFAYDEKSILPTTFKEFFKDRAPRPRMANLKNDKLCKLGVYMSTFDEGLAKIIHSQKKRV